MNPAHTMEDQADKLSETHRRNLAIIGATALLPCLAIVITCAIAKAPEGLVALFPYAILHLVIWGLAIPAFERLPVASWFTWTLVAPAVAIGIMVFCKTGTSDWWWWFVTGIYAEIWWVVVPISAINSSITLWLTRKDRAHCQPLKGNHFITRTAYKLFG